ncbi:MAG TPA: tRNA pseudouridine(55) synthase TruB [Candidatus Binatia bacterium]|jgi:tRNA pseudouridine55 synthase
MHGILLVDKPEGLTSAAVVARVKRAVRAGRAAKVGHLGTLDPFATGLLPICLGEATKLAQFLAAEAKRYVGEIVLGVATDTLDRTGNVVEIRPVPALTPALVGGALAGLRGPILQTPPMYSALKQGGVPLYRLARQGQEVERPARPVDVTAFDVAVTAPDRLAFAVACSKGTYVRVLAQDLGAALGTVAHLSALRRTEFGPFGVGEAVPLDRVDDLARDGALLVVSLSAAMMRYRAVVADAGLITAIRHGRQQALHVLGAPHAAAEVVRIESADGVLVAVAEAAGEGGWRLARVMAS